MEFSVEYPITKIFDSYSPSREYEYVHKNSNTTMF